MYFKNRDLDTKTEYPFNNFRHLYISGIGTIIGKKGERSPKYTRLAFLDCQDNEKIRKYYYYEEIRHFLSKLDISLNKFEINRECIRFYNNLPKRTYFRNKGLIVPVVIYIEAMNHFIFINRQDLQRNLEFSMKKFYQCLQKYYQFRRNLYLKHLSREFRVKYIYMLLSGMKQQFNFPREFLTYGINILNEFYYDLRNKKNTLIAGLIFAAINKQLSLVVKYNKTRKSLSNVCNWLGIGHSTLLRLGYIIKRLL